jgi:hypothetical protein
MDIKSVNRNKQVTQSETTVRKKVKNDEELKESQTAKMADTFEQTPDITELKPVMDKLRSGFYDKPEVLAKLANILDEKFPPEMLNKIE